MPVSDLIRLGTGTLTPRQLTDMALAADQERRHFIREGDLRRAAAAMRERNALIELAR